KFSFSHQRKKWPRGTKGHRNPTAHHVGSNGRWTPVRHILNINACHVFEKLSREVGGPPRANVPIRQFGWLGASQRNKVLHGLGWHLVVDQKQIGISKHLRDGDEIRLGVIRQFLIKDSVHGDVGGGQYSNRVAV